MQWYKFRNNNILNSIEHLQLWLAKSLHNLLQMFNPCAIPFPMSCNCRVDLYDSQSWKCKASVLPQKYWTPRWLEPFHAISGQHISFMQFQNHCLHVTITMCKPRLFLLPSLLCPWKSYIQLRVVKHILQCQWIIDIKCEVFKNKMFRVAVK